MVNHERYVNWLRSGYAQVAGWNLLNLLFLIMAIIFKAPKLLFLSIIPMIFICLISGVAIIDKRCDAFHAPGEGGKDGN